MKEKIQKLGSLRMLFYGPTPLVITKPALREAALCALRFAVAAILAACTAAGQTVPAALCFLAVSGGRLQGLSALLGLTAGAMLWRGLDSGLGLVAAGVLIFSAEYLFSGSAPAKTRWFSPLVCAGMTAVIGFVFVFSRGPTPTTLMVYLSQVAVAGIGTAAFHSAQDDRTVGGELFVLACMILGLAAMSLPGGLSLGAVAAAALTCASAGGLAGTEVALCCGLALDLAAGGSLYMTAILGFASLICAPMREQPRPLRGGLFLLCCTAGLLFADGNRLFAPAAALGAALALVPPLTWPEAASHSVETAQPLSGRLEKVSDTLDRLRRMLTGEDTLRGAREASTVFDRTADKVCRSCIQWALCWERSGDQTYRALCSAVRPMMARGEALREDFPPEFTSRCRQMDSFLTAVNQELDSMMYRRQLHSRMQESRTILSTQYGSLSKFLRDAARQMQQGPPETKEPQFEPVIGVAAAGRRGAGVSGDRGACFRGPNCQLFVLLCDGMGTGPEAAAESAGAVEMLTGLLQAGVEANEALELLNGAYILRGDGVFSTVDLLEVSLVTGEGNLYKWGGAPSFLRAGKTVRKIGTASPPPGFGVGEDNKAEAIRLSLGEEEWMVLVSDGAGGEDAAQCISGYDGQSPKELAQQLITCAEEEKEGEDDRTAVCFYLRSASAH